MANFISKDCNVEELDFFHSPDYLRASFSTEWQTRTIPDTDVSSTPVYELVLEKFNIPMQFPNGRPSGGTLPGIDIHRMDALQTIAFSLAEGLLVGQWWEMYEDNVGGVYFQNVFNNGSPGKWVNLDVRLCLPAAKKENTVDMVIIRGYDPPPERYVGTTYTVVPVGSGPVNPAIASPGHFTVDERALVGGCLEKQLSNTAIKSYPDPIRTNIYGEQGTNPFYSLGAWETLIAHAISMKGMPEGKEASARVQYNFREETTWFYEVPSWPTFTRSALGDICTTGFQTGGGIVFYEGSFIYDAPNYIDRYGYSWPFVIKPAGLLATGYAIKGLSSVVAANLAGRVETSWTASVSPIPELIKISKWFFLTESPNRYEIKIYYQPENHPDYWDVILGIMGGSEGTLNVMAYTGTETVGMAAVPFTQSSLGMLPGSGYGYLVSKMWLALTLDQPSIAVTDVLGDARTYSDALYVEFAPLLLRNLPIPIGYKWSGGVVTLGPDELAEAKPDSDPTTCQNFQTTPESIMQDRMEGNVIEASFPFCKDEVECGYCAETIYDYQNFGDVQTFTLTCGPNDEPELGAAVNGYDSSLRIESINYSYQDGSSYNIEVTLGPRFVNVGSWSENGPWIRQVDEASRKAIITWSAGNGADYRVYVQGLGDFNAINSAKNFWRVGEMVSVSVKNIPKEI